MTPEELVRRFATAVAAGGGMILNVGPGADGQIPLLQQERLLQLGQWLDLNWEGIYGSRPWTRTGEDREVMLERVDSSIDFDWVRNTPGPPVKEDDSTVVWTGFIQPEFSEMYTFEAEADDGVRVWIRDDLVVDRWREGDEPTSDPARVGQEVRFQAGQKYPIQIEYFETKQNASVRLLWSSRSRPLQVVPTERLFPTSRSAQGVGLKGEYRSTERYLAYTQKDGDLFAVFFHWPDEELALPIPPPHTDTSIRLLGLDRDLPWRASGDSVYVDLSGIPYREIPGRWAWTVRLSGYVEPVRESR